MNKEFSSGSEKEYSGGVSFSAYLIIMALRRIEVNLKERTFYKTLSKES
jgi:hypothetical protein